MECITNILIKNNANKKDYQTTYESFAKVWANNYSKSTKVLQSLIDTHSPNEIRVNGVLSSTKKFYETYKIDSKDLMYIEPEKSDKKDCSCCIKNYKTVTRRKIYMPAVRLQNEKNT